MLAVGFLRGSSYEDIPQHPYDLIFVDGPDVMDEGRETCNLTFVDFVSQSETPIVGITDKRLSTVLAHRIAVGAENAAYSPYFEMSVTRPVSKRDFLIGKKMPLKRLESLVPIRDSVPFDLIEQRAS
jgi:hypothetical protein